MKETLFLVGLLLLVAESFFISHFWSYAIAVVQKAVALGIFPVLLLSKLLAGVTGLHLLV